jgi:hypothetical protein
MKFIFSLLPQFHLLPGLVGIEQLHGLPPESWSAILAAHPGVFAPYGLTVMSTSFLSSTLLDAGSVVWFMEAHPTRNATQIRHAIHFFMLITEYLLPSACRRSLFMKPLPPAGQLPEPLLDVRAALCRDILVPEGLLVDGSCLVHLALPLVYLAQQHVGIRVIGVAGDQIS